MIYYTRESLIEKLKLIHNDKYTYDKLIYKSGIDKVIVTCKIHGDFHMIPRSLIQGHGCLDCSGKKKLTTEIFIKRAIEIHGFRYGYDKVDYRGANYKVIIKCFKHDYFEQKASHHINHLKQGCPQCATEKIGTIHRTNQNEFIQKCNEIHNFKYTYDFVEYKNQKSKVIITCLKHGNFAQRADIHLDGHGCRKCITYSKTEKAWLDYLNIPKEFRGIELKIDDRRFYPDALDLVNKKIWEFNGDFWHGNPELFKTEDINHMNKKTFGELYLKTLEKVKILESAGYTIISIWESDWRKIRKKLNKKTESSQ